MQRPDAAHAPYMARPADPVEARPSQCVETSAAYRARRARVEKGMTTRRPVRPFRSRDWFADSHRSDMTALYLERFMNYGVTPDELRSGRPIIGIAQTGSD